MITGRLRPQTWMRRRPGHMLSSPSSSPKNDETRWPAWTLRRCVLMFLVRTLLPYCPWVISLWGPGVLTVLVLYPCEDSVSLLCLWGPCYLTALVPSNLFFKVLSTIGIWVLDLKMKLYFQVSKISLVDLAGSERADSSGAKGTRLKVRGHKCHARVRLTKISSMSSKSYLSLAAHFL